MKEVGRILSRPRLLAAFLLILTVNGVLFAREQVKNDYGLDVSLPIGGTFIVNGEYTVTNETVDAKAAYRRYLQWIGRVRDLPVKEAADYLKEQEDRLSSGLSGEHGEDSEETRLDYIAVRSLLAQTDYLTGYGDWLETIQKNKDRLLAFSLFSDPGSFSERNILRTAEEFERLEHVELTPGADGAVNSFMSFRLTDYFLLLVLLLIGLSFLEERKAGLWSVVHAAPRGRLLLAVRRVLILFFASAGFTLLLYGSNLLIGFSVYGGADGLGRSVQSVEVFGRLPELWTVGGFLVRFFLLRIAAAFLVSLLLWLMLTAVNNVKYAILVAAGVLAAEYGLYTFLPVQSAFNILKYFNLFTYISLSDLYTNYLNIDIFSYPLGIRSISQLALIPLCLILAAVCVTVHCLKRPAAGRDLLGRVAYKLNSVTDKFLRCLHLPGIELYKTLWIQKGIVIVALLVYVVFGLSYTVSIPIMSSAEQAAKQYRAQFAGEITGDTFARMDAEQAELDAVIAARGRAQADFDAGLIEYPMLDKYNREAAAAQTKSEGLSKVRARATELQSKGEAENFTPWLIDETPFESVYGSYAGENQQKAALVAVLALALLLAGSMACERQSGMTCLLKSTARGRSALLLCKLLLAAGMTTLVWAAVYGREVYTLLHSFEISAWSAPAKNLSMLTAFSLPYSLAGALALLYAFRWYILFCSAILVLFISGRLKRMEAACLAASVVVLLPSLLFLYVGIGIFRPLSILLPVAAMPLLTAAGGDVSVCLPWLAALTGISAVLLVLLFVSGNGTKN